MSFRYVVLTPADQQAWRAVRLDALERFPDAFLTTADEQRARPASEDRAGLAQGAWRGIRNARDLIGIAALIPMRHAAAAHRMEVGAFYVGPDHWGTGAAQALLEAMIQEAETRGAKQLELCVAEKNARAIQFYERNGFVRYGTQPRAILVNGVGQDDFFYVRLLDC